MLVSGVLLNILMTVGEIGQAGGQHSLMVPTIGRRSSSRIRAAACRRLASPAQPLGFRHQRVAGLNHFRSPVNSRDKSPNPRIATLHCAIVKAPDSHSRPLNSGSASMADNSLPSVGQLLVAAFGISRTKNTELNQRWITMSWQVGSQLPQSLLPISIQRLGEVDLVCRTLENELGTQPPKTGEMDLRPNYLSVLSEWWIGSAYAVCYTLKDRKIISDTEFLRLADELRMIRVQIEKYEVPSDRGLAKNI
jgi:hypothetical protein